MAPDQLVQITARPHPVRLNLSRAAVVVIDMENDFGAVGGRFNRAGLDISGIQATIVPTARVLDAARRAGIPVVYLTMFFRPDLSNIGPEGTPNCDRHLFFGVGQNSDAPDGTKSRVLIHDTWNTQIVPGLRLALDETVVYKHRFSGSFGTELDTVLRSLGVTDLIFTGCTTSVCVESTLRDAMFRDYRCLLLEDCTAEPIGDSLPRGHIPTCASHDQRRPFGCSSSIVHGIKAQARPLHRPARSGHPVGSPRHPRTQLLPCGCYRSPRWCRSRAPARCRSGALPQRWRCRRTTTSKRCCA